MKQYSIIIICLLAISIGPVRAQLIYSENFENTTNNALPAGWYASAMTPGAWKTGVNTDFLLPGNGIPPVHSTFIGLKLDSNWEAAPRADTLITPVIPLQNAQVYNNPTLYMDLYYAPFLNDNCSIDMSYDGGNVWINVYYNMPIMHWQPFFIPLPQFINKSSVMFRFIHKTTAGAQIGGLYMDDIRLYDQTNVDAAVYDVTPHADSIHNYAAMTGLGDTISASVVNMTSHMVTDLVLKYKLGNGPVYADTFTSLNLAGFDTITLKHHKLCNVPAVSGYALKAWVEATGDGDNTNDTGYTNLIGAAFMPVKIPVTEERGGTWCGWCIRGIYYNDSLSRIHPEASIISVHNNGPSPDPMAVPIYDTFMGHLHINGTDVSVFGFPVIVTDRRKINDPYGTIYDYETYKQYFAYGNISFGPSIINNNDLTVDVHFKPAIDMNGQYRLALVLTEDSVHKDSMFYSQTNAYSYQLSNTPFHGYELLPMSIPAAQMYYNFVARRILNDPMGATGSLPAQMSYNNTYTYTFHTTLDTNWKQEKMKLVAMLIHTPDTFILNSANKPLLEPVGLPVYTLLPAIEIYPNPASEELYIKYSFDRAANISIALTDMLGHMVYDKEQRAGTQQLFAIPVKGLPAGLYNLSIKTPAGKLNRLVTVTN